MRVVSVLLSHAPHLQTPTALLDEYRTTTGWGEALVSAGLEPVNVIGFRHDAEQVRDGARYLFVRGFGGRSGDDSPTDPHAPMRGRRIPWRLLRRVVELEPDVVHLHSLIYALQARALRSLLPDSTALVVQHHAETPYTGLRAPLQRWGLAGVDAFFFNGESLAEPFRRAGVIRPRQKIYGILEGSLWDEAAYEALEALPAAGRPALFWVGNLNSNKDPLTILGGFEAVLEDYPEAHLHMAFRHDDLLPQVRERLTRSPRLASAVTLHGALDHRTLVRRLRGADVFVQGSHHEGSGYGLVDALACGLVPVVTDIPSFRFLLGDACGAYFSPGDRDAFERALRDVFSGSLPEQKRVARRHFEHRLSWPALGRAAAAAYADAAARRRSSISSE